ncbi:MAG: hypothetical protein HQL20_05385 [Candidatus Omnitrophica bacterium]|nr:hypothetical protein [Candidatus Omnitrophota bacterium]
MVKERSKQAVKKVVKAAAPKKSASAVAPKGAASRAVLKKVSYKTGLLCRKVKGKVSGLSKVAQKSGSWKKVVGVTGNLCEKVGVKTGDVIGKFSRIMKKSAADMGESFKAGMASVKPKRGEEKIAPVVRKPAPKKAVKAGKKPKSRLEKFISDDVSIASAVSAAAVSPEVAVEPVNEGVAEGLNDVGGAHDVAVAAEELGAAMADADTANVEAEMPSYAQEEVQTIIEEPAAIDAELEREIAEVTKGIKEDQ